MKIKAEWEPSTEGGIVTIDIKHLKCKTEEEFMALSEEEKLERMEAAFAYQPDLVWPVFISWRLIK